MQVIIIIIMTTYQVTCTLPPSGKLLWSSNDIKNSELLSALGQYVCKSAGGIYPLSHKVNGSLTIGNHQLLLDYEKCGYHLHGGDVNIRTGCPASEIRRLLKEFGVNTVQFGNFTGTVEILQGTHKQSTVEEGPSTINNLCDLDEPDDEDGPMFDLFG